MFEIDSTLTSAQMAEFTSLFDKYVGTDYEVNPDPSGERDKFYIVVIDLEEENEYKICEAIEKLALLL